MKQENIRNEVDEGKREKGTRVDMKLLKQLCERSAYMWAGLLKKLAVSRKARDIKNSILSFPAHGST